VATASTKSRGRKRKGDPEDAPASDSAAARDPRAAAGTDAAEADGLSPLAWRIGYFAVLAAALLFRVVELGLRPMHHDEGVNGHFLLNLLRAGSYRYDPSNYHGPTLYYFTLPLARLADASGWLDNWVVRLVPVAFGMATVWLALSLRRYLGAVGALAAGALLAVSPGMVFFSRYYIHEMPFVFFTMGVVVAALRYYESEGRDAAATKAAKGGRFIPGVLAGVGVAASCAVILTAVLLVMLGGLTAYASVGLKLGLAGFAGLFVFLSLYDGTLPGVGSMLSAVALVASSLLAVYYPDKLRVLLACAVLSLAALVWMTWAHAGPRSIYLALGSASAALLFATKETAFISLGVILIAWATTEAWLRINRRAGWARAPEARRKKRDRRAGQADEDDGPRPLRLVSRLGGWGGLGVRLYAAAGLFLFVNILYFSSFFKNQKGVRDAVAAYEIWKKTGESGFHGYRWYKYLQWLVGDWNARGVWEFGEELPLLLLATLGAALSLWRTRRRFPLFVAQWGFGLLAAYSIIVYKTPWLILSALLPFALAGGYAVAELYRRPVLRGYALALLSVCLAVAAFQSYRLNFVNYDSDRYPYVYAHTKRSFHDLMAEIERAASRAGGRERASLNVAVENQEYWPLPWYLRDWKRIGYVGRVTQTSDDMVLVKEKQVAEFETALGARYRRVGDTFELRPGVKLVLYVRRDLAP
jgi:uncharacterized protein (TIGR03663 family)